MRIAATIEALNNELGTLLQAGKTLALVPTMGNLHEGHLSLVAQGLERADAVVVTIFVNPLQFGPSEDLDAYPRTLDDDINQLIDAGASLLFCPTTETMYPDGLPEHSQVRVPGLTDVLCGASRPGHFDGVTTVVAKLFNLIRPDVAIFGEKDLQQLLVIRKMTRDLAFPIEIIGAPIARAHDGLALSSRNGYLSAAQRATAPLLQAVLQDLATAIQHNSSWDTLIDDSLARLSQAGFEPDYLDIRRREDLAPASPGDTEIALFAAAKLGTTRLIDNIQLNLAAP
jgi:pantoate--beta-alanine ligase